MTDFQTTKVSQLPLRDLAEGYRALAVDSNGDSVAMDMDNVVDAIAKADSASNKVDNLTTSDIEGLSDALELAAGASTTIQADGLPLAMATTETQLDFKVLYASTNGDILTPDDAAETVTFAKNGRYQLLSSINITNSTSQDAEATFYVKNDTTDAILHQRTATIERQTSNATVPAVIISIDVTDAPLVVKFSNVASVTGLTVNSTEILIGTAAGGGAAIRHNLTTNRDADNAHPISAIAGLRSELDTFATTTSVDAKLALKADKTYVDDEISDINTSIRNSIYDTEATGINIQKLKGIKDIIIENAVEGRVYTITSVSRDDDNMLYYIKIFSSSDNIGSNSSLVASISETNVVLDELATYEISGSNGEKIHIIVKWGDIISGTYNTMWANGYKLRDSVFNVKGKLNETLIKPVIDKYNQLPKFVTGDVATEDAVIELYFLDNSVIEGKTLKLSTLYKTEHAVTIIDDSNSSVASGIGYLTEPTNLTNYPKSITELKKSGEVIGFILVDWDKVVGNGKQGVGTGIINSDLITTLDRNYTLSSYLSYYWDELLFEKMKTYGAITTFYDNDTEALHKVSINNSISELYVGGGVPEDGKYITLSSVIRTPTLWQFRLYEMPGEKLVSDFTTEINPELANGGNQVVTMHGDRDAFIVIDFSKLPENISWTSMIYPAYEITSSCYDVTLHPLAGMIEQKYPSFEEVFSKKYKIGEYNNYFDFDDVKIGDLKASTLQMSLNYNIPTDGAYISTDVENTTERTDNPTIEELLKAFIPYFYYDQEKKGTIVLYDVDGSPFIFDKNGNKLKIVTE